MTLDVQGWGIAQFREAVRRGVRPAAIADAALRVLAELPPAVLIGTPLTERARADAAALDGADPDELPLLGVPYVVKDNFDVAGCITTAGCPGFGDLATADATVVERLRRAGALVVGRTNMDQFATGLVGTRSPYGTPPNCLRPGLVPGGSSSGSAVAVGLGAVPFSLGTDTAGSGRVPAAFNGIVGLKPTLGRVSTAGIVPAVRRLDCPSIFSRSIADASDVLRVIAGADAADAFSRAPKPVPPLQWPPVVGVPALWPEGLALTDEMRRWFEAAVARVAEIGGRIETIDVVPLLALGDLLYGSAVVGERTAAVGDAVARGVDGLDPVVAQIIGDGTRYSAVDAYRTEYRLAELRAEAARIWAEVDVIALPTTPRLATVDEVRADPFGVNRQLGQLTTFVNLAGAACVVVPMEPDIPAGLQLVAPAWHDDELLRLAEGYLSGHLPPPAPSRTLVVVGADTLAFSGWRQPAP
jgi:allophanate hydrolase